MKVNILNEKVITLEKRGCDFFKNDPIEKLSDVGNYRVGIYNNIQGKDGNRYTLEFSKYDYYKYRDTTKNGSRKLKKAVKELVLRNKLSLNTEFEREDGSVLRNIELEKKISNMNLTYTKENILKVINYISKIQYSSIEFK